MNILQSIILYISSFLIALSPMPTYTEGVVGQPVSFLPNSAVTDHDKTISRLIYRGLFKYDIYGVLVPDLAETWESSDGLTYVITLKDNQYWSNGKKITADDLIYTSFKVEDLAGVATDKVNDLKVRYTLPNKYSPFLSLLTVGVMPSNETDRNKPLTPVTSGDFRVVRVESTGKIIKNVVLYNTNSNDALKKISFKYYPNEEELVLASKLGEIDAFLTSNNYELDNFNNHKFPLQGIYYALYFNLRDETLKDLEFRKKLEKTLPVKNVIGDRGIEVQGSVSRSLFTDRDLKFDKYDEKFKEESVEGEENKQIEITMPDIKEHEELAGNIRDLWEQKLNVDIVIKKIPAQEMLKQVIEPRKFQILLYGQEIGRDPDRYVIWHSTQKEHPGLNLSGFEHVRADRALEEGRNETENEKRLVHYGEFQKVISEQVPIIFLYHPFTNYYVSKYIEGIGEKYTFTPYDRFLDFFNWSRLKTN